MTLAIPLSPEAEAHLRDRARARGIDPATCAAELLEELLREPEPTKGDAWLESLRRMADNGVKITRPADDSRESIYEGSE